MMIVVRKRTLPIDRRRLVDWLFLLAFLLAASLLRCWRLNSLPPDFYYDEAYEGVAARPTLTQPTYRPLF